MSPARTASSLTFGAPGSVDGSLSGTVRGVRGSEILKIASDIRRLKGSGRQVCDLTVGDFDPRLFPIPQGLIEEVRRAYAEGETNYPPSDGVPALREAVVEFVARRWGARYPVESVLIAGGARPILYGSYRTVLDPGEAVAYTVPSWNNNHYARLCAAESIVVTTRPEDGFLPDAAQLAPHLSRARMLVVNSPLNPTGTVMAPDRLRAIVEAVAAENVRRDRDGLPHLFLLHDQVYASLVFGATRHVMPVALVPESAPWVISLDGISKSLAATGLRVGWMLADPEVTSRMKNLLGHVGAWAPRPEQIAVARFLADDAAVDAFEIEMGARVRQRLEALHVGFERLRAKGYPVGSIEPQGAIYLSLRLDLIGRRFAGTPIASNEAIRRLLLDQAGLAVIPFQAFGLDQDTGWFRLSVGAISLEDVEQALPRLAALLDRLE